MLDTCIIPSCLRAKFMYNEWEELFGDSVLRSLFLILSELSWSLLARGVNEGPPHPSSPSLSTGQPS